MKRISLLIISMMCATMALFSASNAKCLLQHNGSGKIYEADAIETAIKNAVDGDTIFLTEGQFPGFTVNKKITVRGAGQGTKITGAISVSISGTPTLTQTVLEGFDASSQSITLATSMNGVKIKQCNFQYLYTNANNNDVIIDRCYISQELCYSDYIKGMTVVNSWIIVANSYSSTNSAINFVNCYVTGCFVDRVAGTFINCIVKSSGWWGTSRYYRNCQFVNSLLCGSYITCDSSSTTQNCYENTSATTFDVNTLENLGYLGNDNTVVGEYGGLTPYTLELAVPKVTENTIVLDPTKKVLNVSLKVSAN